MGSSASSNMKPLNKVNNESNGCKSLDNGKPPNSSSPQRRSKDVFREPSEQNSIQEERYKSKALIKAAEEDSEEYRNKVAELERQMVALQSANLDYQEQVQALEERLQMVTSDHQLANQENDFSITIQAKDQFIEKQQEEIKTAQKQHNILKAKYRRKLKGVNVQLSEAKHEWSLQVFELKQEISRLTDENCKLQEKNECSFNLDASVDCDDGRKSALEESCDSRMKIILELSKKVSDQDVKIIALENKIREQNKLIDSHQRSNSASAKRGRTSRQNSTLESKNTAEINELKSIAEEMKLLQKNKKKGKGKTDHEDFSDYRQASGISRDSGISSAGISTDKVHTSGGKTRPIRIQSAASTMSAFSEDLDEGETNVHNYISNGRKNHADFIDDRDSWDDSDNEGEAKASRRLELRQISAPKHKKKTKTSDFEYIDNLLTDAENSGHFPNSAFTKSGFLTEVGTT